MACLRGACLKMASLLWKSPPSNLLLVSPLCSRITEDFPCGRVRYVVHLWDRGQATPHSWTYLMNGLFVGLWKQAANPPFTSIWPGLYISCSLGPQWTSAPTGLYLIRGLSHGPGDQPHIGWLLFHLCFCAKSSGCWTLGLFVNVLWALFYTRGCFGVNYLLASLLWLTHIWYVNRQSPVVSAVSPITAFSLRILLMRWKGFTATWPEGLTF